MNKLSIIIPVYYNEETIEAVYNDILEKVVKNADFKYEIIMVDDGSGDKSFDIIKKIAGKDKNVKAIKLSRNFGSHAAILCGLSNCSGDCAVIKTADMQEPSALITDMYSQWKKGYNVVLAVRKNREESGFQRLFANMYYWLVRKFALKNMPKGGFDVFLLDRKVINCIELMDEKNTAITGQILWLGFKTTTVFYTRKARQLGKSRWTLKKKIKLVKDSLFSFSTVPISFIWIIGCGSSVFAIIIGMIALIGKLMNRIEVSGYTTIVILGVLFFGVIMITLGVIIEYLYRTFDASRKRPPYIEEISVNEKNKNETEN